MQNNQPNGYSRPASVAPDNPQRSLLSSMFILSLGVVYPAFLCLIFLKPELLEHLFNSSSGYFISGLGLLLLGFCFVLATAHFRSADRQYRQASDHTLLPPPDIKPGGPPLPNPEP